MFYILTCGSTASVWLARALCRHPEIVCFHGKRTIGIPTEASREMEARQLVRELGRLYSMAEGEKVFGAIHGHSAAEIVPEIAGVGAFAAMMRHPITRVNSFFHQQAPAVGSLELAEADIYRPLRKADPEEPLIAYAHLFSALCNSVLSEDTFILGTMNQRDIFQYERIVADPQYFRDCFERLAQGCRNAIESLPLPLPPKPGHMGVNLKCTQRYLDHVFNMGSINPKNTGASSASEIFASWPETFKAIFVCHLQQQGGETAMDRYVGFGYQLPDELRPLMQRRPSDFAQEIVLDQPKGRTQAQRAAWRPAASAHTIVPKAQDAQRPESVPSGSLEQLQAIIEMQRRARASEIADRQEAFALERNAFIARIRALEAELDAERRAQAAQIAELQHIFAAEREAAVARIRALEADLDAERRAQAGQIADLQQTFAAEREAAVARIRELERTLRAERDAFVARIIGNLKRLFPVNRVD